MDLYNFRNLLIDSSQHVNLYDLTSDSVVFDGDFDEMPRKYEYCEIMSIDNVYDDCDGIITLNIEL